MNSDLDPEFEFIETTTIYEAQYPNKFDVLWKNFLFEPPNLIGIGIPKKFFEILNDCQKISRHMILVLCIYNLGQENCERGLSLHMENIMRNSQDLLWIMEWISVFYTDEFLNVTNHPELKTCDWESTEGADLAWAVQKAMEYILVLRVKQVLKKPDTKNIVFSGGCAMNICANTVMCEEFPNINFFIDPIAGDAGQYSAILSL